MTRLGFARQFCKGILTLWAICVAIACSANDKLHVSVLEEKKHDPLTFTQGLVWQKGKLFESSGLYGKSFLRRYDANTLDIEQHTPLPSRIFAEGLTLYNNQLYLLTWRAGQLIVLDAKSLQPQKHIAYTGEGWGLSHDGKHFIMSDGSENLYFRDSQTFEVVRKVQVHSKWRKYQKLNELEYAQGAIWANVWQAPYILKIAPETGEVLGIASLQHLVKENSNKPSHSVLNGIAYDETRNAFWVTGKLWPKRYLVRFDKNTDSANKRNNASH